MASDKEYSVLFNKYNLAILKAKDLQEQMDVKTKQWKKTSEDYSVSEKNMRELCSIILAKDTAQMNNDEKGTWNNYEINELIRETIKSYRKYNEERTNLMRKISDVAEERAFTINELNEEILHLKRHGGVSSNSEDNYEEKADKKEEKANVSKTSPNFQKAVEKGNITVKTAQKIKDDLKEGVATAYYDEDDEEILEGEKTDDIHKSNMKNNITAKATPHSIQSVHTGKGRIKKKKMKDEVIDEVYGEKLKEMVKKMSEDSWAILKIIGESGKSTAKDLKALGINDFEKRKINITERGILAKLSDLSNIGVLIKEIIITPLSGKMTVYNLTSEGGVLYKRKFGKEVVISEYDKVIAEHDNLEHGYGILQCGEIIAELEADNKRIFEKVSVWNRKNPIKIKSANGETNLEYIPDIVCVDSNGSETYIEYELNNHKQNSFNSKCSKMFMAGINKINFIVPNKEIALELNNKVLKWIETKRNSNNIKYITVRVTTAKSLEGLDIRKDENWMFVLYPSKSSDFEVNF